MAQWLKKKNPSPSAGDARNVGSIPGSGRSPAAGNGNSLQYFCLGNPMDRGAWWATVHGVAMNWTQMSTHTPIKTFCVYFAIATILAGLGFDSRER